MGRWTQQDIPDQSGRVAIVTGANSGIGFETARELCRKGADVVLACRSAERGEAAVEQIMTEQPDAKARFMALDLADLEQVAAFVAAFRSGSERLDLLINNAGVMVPPAGKTKQGFELQIGVNHMGHFALTGRLLDLLLTAGGARVVNVASTAHKIGKLNLDDLNWESRGYKPWPAYGQSKLANLLFTFELQRRLEAAGHGLIAAAAHPGYTSTNLQQNTLARIFNPMVAMPQWQGALPTLYTATSPEVSGGDYIGPSGWFELRGWPKKVGCSKAARNEADAARLWQVSEEATGVRYALAAPAAGEVQC